MRYAFLSLLCAMALEGGYLSKALQERLESTGETEMVDVIVHMAKQGSTDPFYVAPDARAYIEGLKALAAETQAPMLDWLKSRNALFVESWWAMNGVHVFATPDVVREIATREDVGLVHYNYTVTLVEPMRGGAEPDAVEWGVQRIGAPQVWALGYLGTGVVLGGMDTGVQADHPALNGKIRPTNGWYDAVNGSGSPYDDNGHGTHTTGTMVGGDGPGPFANDIGVSPGSQYIMAKVFNSAGSGAFSWIQNGFQWIEGLAATNEEPDAVNNSWGSDNTTYLGFWNNVVGWRNVGIIPVFSSGNAGPGGGTAGTPGNFPTVIGVGATDASDNIASFSSRGPAPNQNPWNDPANWPRADWNLIKPNISAPGVNIRSSIPTNSYAWGSGTSMSCPHVTGCIGLIKEKVPSADFTFVYNVIVDSAAEPSQGAPYPNNDYGWGLLDCYAAVLGSISIDVGETGGASRTSLTVVSPNPTRGSFVVELALPAAARVDAAVYDASGALVERLADGTLGAGTQRLATREALSSGVYILRVVAGDKAMTKRFTVAR